jgi:two-component system response regulator VicR
MSRRPTILLVEDDPGTRQLMAILLDAEGYLVQTAGNGREALALLETEVPCAMVVDLDMPVMDGAELRRHQQDMPAASSVPFILVSGAHNAEGIARELGIADIVAKPFDEAQLLRIIAAACHRLD